jgi:hypothetical protein
MRLYRPRPRADTGASPALPPLQDLPVARPARSR